jgi:uncharacterized membrane protein YidH (DUF202 family)
MPQPPVRPLRFASPIDQKLGFWEQWNEESGFGDHSANERTFLAWVRTAIAKLRRCSRAQQFELRHDFKGVRRRRRRQSTAKLCFVIEIRRSSGRFSPWRDDQINRREFTLNA